MTDRISLNDMTSDQLDQLYADLDHERETFGRLALRLDTAIGRAEDAEAAIARVRKAIDSVHASASRNEPATGYDHGYATARDWVIGRVLEAIDARLVRRQPTPTAATQATDHRYLSTGCLHGDRVWTDGRTGHQYCQSATGKAGTKNPAQCKFCAAPCVCPCHRKPADA